MSATGSALKRFSTGNLESLNVPGVREYLLEYYKNHYSANLLSLCLVGNYSLDELEKLAEETFSEMLGALLEQEDLEWINDLVGDLQADTSAAAGSGLCSGSGASGRMPRRISCSKRSCYFEQ